MIRIVDGLARMLAGGAVALGPEAAAELPPDACVVRSRLVPWLGGRLSGMRGPAAAVTLGRTILVHPDVRPTARLLRHESAHVAQWRRYPASFPFRYIGAHIRHGYGSNPYEVEARRAEGGSAATGETREST